MRSHLITLCCAVCALVAVASPAPADDAREAERRERQFAEMQAQMEAMRAEMEELRALLEHERQSQANQPVKTEIELPPEIQEQFVQLHSQHLGVISAEVETARPLGDQARERLEQALSRTTGKKVQLVEKVRPELIAGIRVQLGSLLIDGTLERQLQELNRAMLG